MPDKYGRQKYLPGHHWRAKRELNKSIGLPENVKALRKSLGTPEQIREKLWKVLRPPRTLQKDKS